ncbi:MAG TPA: hypothetical protein VHC63_09375, partial [Acidimicrobiales bacterium]|nr:hypothetical protein [Acidimicrobiales bacterium]
MIDWRAALRRPREVYARTRHQLHQAREVARGLSLDVAASTEVRQATLRALAEIDARLDVAEAAFADRIADVLVERPSLADTFVRRLVGGSVDDLTNGVAELLTFEHGANSFQSQAGLWVNSP